MIDDKLQKGVHNRDPKTFDILINEYSKLLWVIASGVLKNIGTKEDIEDCIAESFGYLWEYPEKYNQQRGSIKSYLCIITKNKAIDKVRKINKTTTLQYDDDLKTEIDNIEKVLVNKQLINEIYHFAKNLKHLDREIFLLRYFHQLKPREIACKLNITTKEVSNRLYYSRKSLLTKIKL